MHEPIAALLLELPQRALGGTLPAWNELVAQVELGARPGCRRAPRRRAALGCVAFYRAKHRKSLIDIAGLFDTVYVSFYKGLGGIAGCCVAGDGDVIEELSVWRTRHGGRAFGLWPYAASALSALRARLPRMPAYYRHAVAIAEAVRGLPGVEVLPDPVQSPMMHLRFSVDLDAFRERVVEIARCREDLDLRATLGVAGAEAAGVRAARRRRDPEAQSRGDPRSVRAAGGRAWRQGGA